MNLFKNKVSNEDYFIVKYFLESSTDLADATLNLAIGQSIGNPNVRNNWETDTVMSHAAIILGDETKLRSKKSGLVRIAFPAKNLDWKEDGITQLLVQIMGGQLDIAIIKRCHVREISFPSWIKFNQPKYGIEGIRKFTGVRNKPLLGAIIKPKIGINANTLLQMVKELVEGGVNFIKEDEIMSNPSCCPISERVPLVMEYLKDKKVIYAVCINADPPHLLNRVKQVYELGGNAVHVNFWAGLGSYKAIRELDLPIFLFFQKSGDMILTNPRHHFHINFDVICQLACLSGVDFIHTGMWGGYSGESEKELQKTNSLLHHFGVMPSLSCGMHPGLVQAINKRFGVDYLANVGGAIHGHPGGTQKGAVAMRQAIDGIDGDEYRQAISKWGKKD